MDCHLMVGDKVTLVADTKWSCGVGNEKKPIYGKVYTVREVGLHDYHQRPAIRLVEIINPIQQYKGGRYESWFDYKRFRRVVDTTETVAEMARLMRQVTKETVG